MDHNCPKCAAKFMAGTKFCENCGCNLHSEFIEIPTCPQCKAVYPENTKFCTNDGNRLVRPEDLARRCTICNIEYSEEVNFCPADGGAIQPAYLKNLQHTFSGYGVNPQRGSFPKADLGARFLASLLDAVFFALLCIPACLCFFFGLSIDSSFNSNADPIGYYLLAILLYFIPMGYAFVKDGLGRGQSWGKRICSLMVVSLSDNLSCNKGQSFVRNLISGLVTIIPLVGWLVEPIIVLATPDGRKLGDKVANTQVIEVKFYK